MNEASCYYLFCVFCSKLNWAMWLVADFGFSFLQTTFNLNTFLFNGSEVMLSIHQ